MYLAKSWRYPVLRDKVSCMRALGKVTLSAVLVSGLLIAPAEAAKSVPFKNQRAGQFCKTIDIGKSVKLPDGSKLKCLKNGTRARWINP